MTIRTIADVEFGAELDAFHADTSLQKVREFANAVGWVGSGRFEDHEKARKQGLPGALVPGIMSMGFLTSMIHRWSPAAKITYVDTVFRAPMLADQPLTINAVVTDVDEDEGVVELDLTVKNEAEETRVFGTAKVELPPSTWYWRYDSRRAWSKLRRMSLPIDVPRHPFANIVRWVRGTSS